VANRGILATVREELSFLFDRLVWC